MRPEDVPEALWQFAQENLRDFMQARQDELQGVYDRVLHDGQGRSVEEVKDLLADEWWSTFGTNLSDPDLSECAEVLAQGRRIRVEAESTPGSWPPFR